MTATPIAARCIALMNAADEQLPIGEVMSA